MLALTLSIKMNQPVDKHIHVISPGGFEVGFKDGSALRFDFQESYGTVDEDDPSVVRFEMERPDLAGFPEMESLPGRLDQIASLEECFIYTGEYKDPKIRPKELLEFIFETENGSMPLPKELRDKAAAAWGKE